MALLPFADTLTFLIENGVPLFETSKYKSTLKRLPVAMIATATQLLFLR
jgi:hypothetical protein